LLPFSGYFCMDHNILFNLKKWIRTKTNYFIKSLSPVHGWEICKVLGRKSLRRSRIFPWRKSARSERSHQHMQRSMPSWMPFKIAQIREYIKICVEIKKFLCVTESERWGGNTCLSIICDAISNSLIVYNIICLFVQLENFIMNRNHSTTTVSPTCVLYRKSSSISIYIRNKTY
jgi:hypothetical protein